MTNPTEQQRDADEAARRQQQSLPAETPAERRARYAASPASSTSVPARLPNETDADYNARSGNRQARNPGETDAAYNARAGQRLARNPGESDADYNARVGRSPAQLRTPMPPLHTPPARPGDAQHYGKVKPEYSGPGKPDLTNRPDQR